MPKESKTNATRSSGSWSTTPYPTTSAPTNPPAQRSAAIWSQQDDEILLRARASGLNWQPIASRHFPAKTANACRKRHERLVERRHAEDWDTQKLELLAQEYMACRREMWEVLANRLGERWNVVEAKCMEKGLKTLQSTSRTAHRRASASFSGSIAGSSGNSDHQSDSGIGLGSEGEMDVSEEAAAPLITSTTTSSVVRNVWTTTYSSQQQQHHSINSEPQMPMPRQSLPLYKPPPPPSNHRRSMSDLLKADPMRGTRPNSVPTELQSKSSPWAERERPHRAISIQSMLGPAEV